MLLRVTILWLALGYKLSWRKGSRGQRVEWIRALLKAGRSPTGVPGVTGTITAERMAKLAEKCEELMSVERVPKQRLRRLAGLVTWIAGIMLQISAFTAMMWAANSSTTESSVAQAQVIRALKWTKALCQLTCGLSSATVGNELRTSPL